MFLHGNLEEGAYVDESLGFEELITENKLHGLKNAIYEVKRSPRAWFGRFTKFGKKEILS